MWNNAAGTDATVFFTADSGLLRPISGLINTFQGILLGTGDNAGSEASGVWGVNAPTSTNYLTGGFGVQHVSDATRPLPSGDAGGASNATLITTAHGHGRGQPHGDGRGRQPYGEGAEVRLGSQRPQRHPRKLR